ncbi:hypothetical protein NDU88_012689 [Pleurodeles waltl]|uniref:Uncharacterized protein n=1 Tax=Pleurodeles waltl TaxID=8319 RepID=A0AAV7R0W2_PLEWA|nr:hypothetical protein NDU88_012689 [Pleurodeles waltl]
MRVAASGGIDTDCQRLFRPLECHYWEASKAQNNLSPNRTEFYVNRRRQNNFGQPECLVLEMGRTDTDTRKDTSYHLCFTDFLLEWAWKSYCPVVLLKPGALPSRDLCSGLGLWFLSIWQLTWESYQRNNQCGETKNQEAAPTELCSGGGAVVQLVTPFLKRRGTRSWAAVWQRCQPAAAHLVVQQAAGRREARGGLKGKRWLVAHEAWSDLVAAGVSEEALAWR